MQKCVKVKKDCQQAARQHTGMLHCRLLSVKLQLSGGLFLKAEYGVWGDGEVRKKKIIHVV
jgi:hypothetical protein